jgi:protein tyrosine phosphatase domain-containing protein 1
MLELNIGAIFNLQEPGEHPLCGDGLVSRQIGFSYDPEVFNNAGISYFNHNWQDHKTTDCSKILMICHQMDSFVAKGKRVFVHCHAGMGRTAIICIAYLIYSKRAASATEGIAMMRSDRKGVLKRPKA